MLQKGEKEDEEKPVFAPMPAGQKIDTVTLEQAIKMFELPRTVGKTTDGQEIVANIGRFGPYIKVGNTFASIKPRSPFDITLEEAKDLYADKLKKDAAKNIADLGDGLKILNGRFGPYVTDGTKNAKIPKETDPKSLDITAARKLLADAPTRRPRRKASR